MMSTAKQREAIPKMSAEHIEHLQKEIVEMFNKEVARELLLEQDPNIADSVVDRVWEACAGNPFDAPILHKLINLLEISKHV